MPQYSHLLIPEQSLFVPAPKQVESFFTSLVSLGAAPLKSTFRLSQLSGEVKFFQNPFTGETISIAIRKAKKVKDLAAISAILAELEDYDLTMDGTGAPQLPPFRFEYEGDYDFAVHCSLRKELVSTSDWHDEVPLEQPVPFFDQPCDPDNRLGTYHNPETLDVIEVPNAGCARFRIDLEFGKMLFPAIGDRLDLIEPKILNVAQQSFGISFVQGCHWCA